MSRRTAFTNARTCSNNFTNYAGVVYPVSYAYNYTSLRGTSLAQINEPTTLATMWDAGNAWCDCAYEDSGCGWRTREWAATIANDTKNTNWHNGKINILFNDGHVKSGSWNTMVWQNLNNNVTPEQHALQRQPFYALYQWNTRLLMTFGDGDFKGACGGSRRHPFLWENRITPGPT